MNIPYAIRSNILSALKDEKIEGAQINILMTLNEVIAIYKKKGIDIKVYDIFVLSLLIQSQSTLSKS
jgi:hypothetical protein